MQNNELYHYGVLGMKWGKRKARSSPTTGGSAKKTYEKAKTKTAAARDEYDSAKALYNKAFDRAYRWNNPYSLSKAKRQRSNERWAEVADKADKLQKATDKYKEAKKAEKAAKKASKAADKAVRKLNNVKIKDLQKQYGKLEDKRTYGKNADNKANARIDRQMANIDKQISGLQKNR